MINVRWTMVCIMLAFSLMGCSGGGGGGGSTNGNATADTTPPTVPTGLSAYAVSSTQISLSWTASTDNVGVTGYKVYRGGAYLKTVTTASTSDEALTVSTNYCYTVSAIDAASNESAMSSQACATTPWSAYTDNGDGTIKDNVTGYVWQKQDDGVVRTHDDAISYCAGLSLAGLSWQLPTYDVLNALVDTSQSPRINPIFANTKLALYWSSTALSGSPPNFQFFVVNFGTDSLSNYYDKYQTFYVRCVH